MRCDPGDLRGLTSGTGQDNESHTFVSKQERTSGGVQRERGFGNFCPWAAQTPSAVHLLSDSCPSSLACQLLVGAATENGEGLGHRAPGLGAEAALV